MYEVQYLVLLEFFTKHLIFEVKFIIFVLGCIHNCPWPNVTCGPTFALWTLPCHHDGNWEGERVRMRRSPKTGACFSSLLSTENPDLTHEPLEDTSHSITAQAECFFQDFIYWIPIELMRLVVTCGIGWLSHSSELSLSVKGRLDSYFKTGDFINIAQALARFSWMARKLLMQLGCAGHFYSPGKASWLN